MRMVAFRNSRGEVKQLIELVEKLAKDVDKVKIKAAVV